MESGEGYWISGIKKDGSDRHWAGKGKVAIDRKIIPEHLAAVGASELDLPRFVITDIQGRFPKERIHKMQNMPK